MIDEISTLKFFKACKVIKEDLLNEKDPIFMDWSIYYYKDDDSSQIYL